MNDQFNNINYRELLGIYRAVKNSDGMMEYVEEKHKIYGSHFLENINFLIELDIVEEVLGKYKIKKMHTVDTNDENNIKIKLFENLINKNNIYGEPLYTYLREFKFDDGAYKFKPKTNERLIYSSIRNLLIELGVVLQDDEHGTYTLNNTYASYIFINSDKFNLSKFENNLEQKKIIGYQAELQVLKYEMDRIEKFLIKDLLIEHTSQINVAAGYDIKSWTYNEELKTCSERYIEVKAVPSLNSRFYWSRNEVEQSKKLNDYYYLYLLPISVNVGINIEKLIIIQNPYVEIFNGNQWDSEAEVYKITKNKNAKN